MTRKEEILYKILDYPIVQYITIRPMELYSRENWSNPVPTGEARLYLYNNLQELKATLEKYRIKDIDSKALNPSSGYMYLITHNIRVVDIKYRTYSVVLVGERAPNSYNVYKITTRDFYRDSLNFMLFDEIGNLVQSKVTSLE